MSTDSTERRPYEGVSSISQAVGDAIEALHESAHVERVYGDPITTDGKTVVPVARVAYGFGGGFGGEVEAGEGGGAGGGSAARPIGALEITDEGTRFVRFADRNRLAIAAAIGFVIGRLLGRR